MKTTNFTVRSIERAGAFLLLMFLLNACSASERCVCDVGDSSCGDTGAEDAGVPDAGAEDAGIGPPDVGFDRYFGFMGFEAKTTGFFRVETIGGKWWFITPEGHPFFSSGVNSATPYGTPTKAGVRHYEESVKRIYGSSENWAAAQAERFREWGWNTIGAWSDWRLFKEKLPYTIYMALGQGNWQTGAIADYFSSKFRKNVHDMVASTAAPQKEDPFLIGYFLDNEMHWGTDWRSGNLIENYMTLDFAKDAGKQTLISFLKQRYPSVADLNRDFMADGLADWDAVAAATKLYARGTDGAHATVAAWTGMVAEQFFYVTATELKAVDPNHLNLGVRFVAYLVPRTAIQAAGRYVDVMSINFYELIEGLPEGLRDMDPDYLDTRDLLIEHYTAGGKPILISEWSYRAADSGLPNTYPPIYPTVTTQKERAKKFKTYVNALLERDYFVGHHWFIHADQPPEGRFDGENNNFGLVSEADVPYQLLVETSAAVANEIYRPFWEK